MLKYKMHTKHLVHGRNNNLLYATHPTFLNRMQALIWFSMSHEYNEFFKTDKKGIYDLKVVDKKILINIYLFFTFDFRLCIMLLLPFIAPSRKNLIFKNVAPLNTV